MFDIAHIEVVPPVNKDQEAVMHAARLLDRVRPGWARRVDPTLLDLRSCYRCVLGQVFQEEVRAAFWSPYTMGEWALRETGESFIQAVFALNGYRQYWLDAIEVRLLLRQAS